MALYEAEAPTPKDPRRTPDALIAESEEHRRAAERFFDSDVPTSELTSLLADNAMSLENLLRDWWMTKAEVEVQRTVPKAIEYGAYDLTRLGRTMVDVMNHRARESGQDPREFTDAEVAELGVYFYVEGKLGRWYDAILNGRQVSDDTLFDIGVYIRMAQRIREAGGWPGV